MRLRPVGLVLMSLTVTGCVAAPAPVPSAPSAGGSTASKPTVPTDIDGDGLGDSLRLKRTNGHWTLTVVTANGSSVFTSPDWDELRAGEPEPVGLAPLNPVPGSEVIFRDLFSDDLRYQVLTWRDGHLVEVQNPAGTSNRWVVGDEFNVNTGYAFSEMNGQRKLITSETESQASGPVKFVEYAWVSQAWAEQRTWTEDLGPDAVAALCPGFCGVTVTPLPRR